MLVYPRALRSGGQISSGRDLGSGHGDVPAHLRKSGPDGPIFRFKMRFELSLRQAFPYPPDLSH